LTSAARALFLTTVVCFSGPSSKISTTTTISRQEVPEALRLLPPWSLFYCKILPQPSSPLNLFLFRA
jgi:hypothetical protein